MPSLKNLTSRELLLQVDLKRHVALAPNGESGDTVFVADRLLLPDRQGRTAIADQVALGNVQIVPGTYDKGLTGTVVGTEVEIIEAPTITVIKASLL